jgi:iron(III) transport system ATP-binding protein
MISVRNLSKRFQGKNALEEINFELAAGSRTAISGPSGSGKTTLLRLLAGLELPDQGEVHLDGILASRPGWALAPHLRHIGMVFQSPALWPHMTLAENIMFGLASYAKSEARDRLAELLDSCALQGLENRYPDQISGGEARRAALARALAPDPDILLMDEPLTNLNPELKDDLLALIHRVTSAVVTLIYVTHERREAEYLCQEIWTLRRGKLNRNAAILEEQGAL